MDFDLSIEQLSEGISEGICIWSIKDENSFARCCLWNSRMAEITGYTLDEINKRGFEGTIINGNSLIEKISTWMNKQNIDGCKAKEELVIRSKAGERITVSANVTLRTGESGTKHIIATIKDTTVVRKVEQELNEKYDSCKRLLELSLGTVFLHDGEKITWVNAEGAKLIGAETPDSLIGINFMKFLHQNYHDPVKARIKEVKSNKTTIPFFKEKLIKIDGSIIDVEVASTIFPVKGEYQHLTVIRDISPSIKMEEALRKSELKFREVFNNTSNALFINKIENEGLLGSFLDVNDAACRLFDYTREELCSMWPKDISPETPTEAGYNIGKSLIEKGTASFQTELCKKDGSKVPVETSCVVIKLEDEEIVLSVLHDITERINSEKKLVKSKERYRWLIDNLPYAVYVQDGDKILFSNKVGLEYFGMKRFDEIIGKRINEIVEPHPDYRENFQNYISKSSNENGLPIHEAKFIRKSDNEILNFETAITKFPFYEEGNWMLMVRDISERKKAEKLQRDMDEKSRLLMEAMEYERLRTEFFANISHELRTPINVIFSSIQLFQLKLSTLEEYIDALKMNRHIEVMKQNCYRLIRLINNLIDVTKIDSGYFEINLGNHDIVRIVEDITLSVVEYVENKGITLLFDTDIEEKLIACDPDKIERIILNLISNAVKFTEPGGNIEVKISSNSDYVTINVKDNGAGIPEDKQKVIFDRFIQVDKSLKRAREGSGIGLSLVKSLVEMHNGKVCVQSEYGKGSEFVIELPVGDLNDNEKNLNEGRYNMQGEIEKINIEFSDIYI